MRYQSWVSFFLGHPVYSLFSDYKPEILFIIVIQKVFLIDEICSGDNMLKIIYIFL